MVRPKGPAEAHRSFQSDQYKTSNRPLVPGWTQARDGSAGVRIIKGVAAAPAFREQCPSGAAELLDLLDNRVGHRCSR